MSAAESVPTEVNASRDSEKFLVAFLKTLSLEALEYVVSQLAAYIISRRNRMLICSSRDDLSADACILPIAEYMKLRETPEQAEQLAKALKAAASMLPEKATS
jgi:hypothetical protein